MNTTENQMRFLVGMTLCLAANFSFATSVCEVELKRDSAKLMAGKIRYGPVWNKCESGDVLVLIAGSSSKRELISRAVAQNCEISSIRTIGDFVPNIYVCTYLGAEGRLAVREDAE